MAIPEFAVRSISLAVAEFWGHKTSTCIGKNIKHTLGDGTTGVRGWDVCSVNWY